MGFEETGYSSSSFPLSGGNPQVSPYWTDVDTENYYSDSAAITYRETTDAVVLADIDADVQSTVSGYESFASTWAFIATYHEVTYYDNPYNPPPVSRLYVTDSIRYLPDNHNELIAKENGK